MRITIDKHFTTMDMIPRTKEQIKEFKEIYTDGDLLRMFRDATNTWDRGWADTIIRCNLEAFPGGTMETDETHYSVDILLEGFRRFTKIHFYISQSGVVDSREVWDGDKYMPMWTIESYGLI